MPGTVDAQVQYILEEDNTLTIRYHAVTDAATPINLTNHSYFNLAGSGDVLNHTLRLWAKNFTRADENSCPFGTIDPVAGTPMDFTAEKPLSQRSWTAGIGTPTMYAGFPHFHFAARPEAARRFVEAALAFDKRECGPEVDR